MATLEYATILKCRPQLKELLAFDSSVADDLLTEGFIPAPASKKMKISESDCIQTGELVDSILHRIKMKQERYHEFITILRKDPSRESMVELLEKTYSEYRFQPSSLSYDTTEGMVLGWAGTNMEQTININPLYHDVRALLHACQEGQSDKVISQADKLTQLTLISLAEDEDNLTDFKRYLKIFIRLVRSLAPSLTQFDFNSTPIFTDWNLLDKVCQGETLLHKACKGGHADLVQILIDENEADFKAQDIKKHMPLHLAALHGHIELVEKYISSHSTVGDAESTTLLHMACQGGHIRLVRRLIKKYAADVNARDFNKNTPLSLAVWKGHRNVVHELIEVFKCDRYVKGFKKRTLLHQACLGGHLKLTDMLISKYTFRLHIKDKSKNAPICLAARKGHRRLVTQLIDRYECDPNIIGSAGKMLLHHACEGGHLELARILISKYGLNLNAEDKYGNTPLKLAVLHNHSSKWNILESLLLFAAEHGGRLQDIDLLIQLGADINTQNETGRTALMFAAQHDHRVLFEFLRNQGADMYLQDNDGMSIISLSEPHKDLHNQIVDIFEEILVNSAKEGNLSLVEVVLRMGANVNATGPAKEGWTPLMWASWHGHLEVVGHLLKFNPDVNVAAKVGWTALILASREGHCEIIDALINHGADIDQKTEKGWSSLMMAAALGRTQAGKILLERGAKIDCQDLGGYTPLGQACQDGHSDFVNMLIEHNPNLDVNIQTLGSWTPLMLACRKGHLNVAEVLIRNKVDIDLQKPDGVNALHIASYAGYNKTVCYLVQNKANVDIADIHGMTALIFAAKQGHVEVFKTLLWNGKANLNLQEKEANFSAPFFAVQCKHNEMLDISMRNDNINLEIKDIEGNTLLDLAEKQNAGAYELIKQQHKDKIKLLESKKRLPSRAATPGGQLYAGPSTKGAQSENYIVNLLRKIDLRMGQDPGIAASAT